MVKKISDYNKDPIADLLVEYQRIETLFSLTPCVCSMWMGMPLYPAKWSLESFFSCSLFTSWNLRGRSTSIEDRRRSLKIDIKSMKSCFSKEKFLVFIEYVMNVVYQIDIGKSQFDIYITEIHYLSNIFENCISILGELNYRIEIYEKKNEIYIIEKDASATAVSEIFPDISDKVIEYRRFDLKGNLQRKGEILCALYKKFEPIEKKLSSTTYKQLISDTAYLFNVTGIRHWFEKFEKPSKPFKMMKPNELETWYDKTYNLFLTCMLISNYLSIKKEIDEIKRVEEVKLH